MWHFQDTFGTHKRPFVSAVSIFMTVPLISYGFTYTEHKSIYKLFCKWVAADGHSGTVSVAFTAQLKWAQVKSFEPQDTGRTLDIHNMFRRLLRLIYVLCLQGKTCDYELYKLFLTLCFHGQVMHIM